MSGDPTENIAPTSETQTVKIWLGFREGWGTKSGPTFCLHSFTSEAKRVFPEQYMHSMNIYTYMKLAFTVVLRIYIKREQKEEEEEEEVESHKLSSTH